MIKYLVIILFPFILMAENQNEKIILLFPFILMAETEKKTLTSEKIILAGGCFWGMEEIIRNINGVIKTEVGYTGGKILNPDYSIVSSGKSGHSEAVFVEFNPNIISLKELLGYFFRMHDPTTLNQQGNDIGTQYRSSIFYYTEEQKKISEQIKKEVDLLKKWKDPVVTEIVKADAFFPAEDYHQDYLQKNPRGYTCHYLRY
jgi:methionine-S-sulfoxide reductase